MSGQYSDCQPSWSSGKFSFSHCAVWGSSPTGVLVRPTQTSNLNRDENEYVPPGTESERASSFPDNLILYDCQVSPFPPFRDYQKYIPIKCTKRLSSLLHETWHSRVRCNNDSHRVDVELNILSKNTYYFTRRNQRNGHASSVMQPRTLFDTVLLFCTFINLSFSQFGMHW